MRLGELGASGRYALAGLLQLLLSFLVSEVSVESFVGFFPRRKRAMWEIMEGRELERLVSGRDETAKISRPRCG